MGKNDDNLGPLSRDAVEAHIAQFSSARLTALGFGRVIPFIETEDGRKDMAVVSEVLKSASDRDVYLWATDTEPVGKVIASRLGKPVRIAESTLKSLANWENLNRQILRERTQKWWLAAGVALFTILVTWLVSNAGS